MYGLSRVRPAVVGLDSCFDKRMASSIFAVEAHTDGSASPVSPERSELYLTGVRRLVGEAFCCKSPYLYVDVSRTTKLSVPRSSTNLECIIVVPYDLELEAGIHSRMMHGVTQHSRAVARGTAHCYTPKSLCLTSSKRLRRQSWLAARSRSFASLRMTKLRGLRDSFRVSQADESFLALCRNDRPSAKL